MLLEGMIRPPLNLLEPAGSTDLISLSHVDQTNKGHRTHSFLPGDDHLWNPDSLDLVRPLKTRSNTPQTPGPAPGVSRSSWAPRRAPEALAPTFSPSSLAPNEFSATGRPAKAPSLGAGTRMNKNPEHYISIIYNMYISPSRNELIQLWSGVQDPSHLFVEFDHGFQLVSSSSCFFLLCVCFV